MTWAGVVIQQRFVGCWVLRLLQEDENLQGHKELPNTKPMMELDAGSNVWYQAYVLKESINEAKVRFPGVHHDPDSNAS